jgi:HNH endonuclease
MISKARLPRLGYAFNLHLVCGGYAYFSTLASWVAFGQHRREVRRPRLVFPHKFIEALATLGNEFTFINSKKDYERWLLSYGWAIVSERRVRSLMPQWLASRECVTSGLGSYTDISIAAPGVISHSVSKGKRRKVLSRDRRCLKCKEASQEQLTMHHVAAYSHGGETTSRNLVVLCKKCQQKVGESECPELYSKAGLVHGYDPSLFGRHVGGGQIAARAAVITLNMMQTRCEIF